MPELPDITVYIECLRPRIFGQPIQSVRLANPFLLRTVDPPISAVEGQTVCDLRRLGKRIAIGVEGDLYLVLHLMIAGRLHWRDVGAKLSGRTALAAFDFPNGSLVLTEAATKKRASLHVVAGEAALEAQHRHGLEPIGADLEAFTTALQSGNHTVKRALTDPRQFSGIGNAYSDEILHRARLSPIKWVSQLNSDEIARLHTACQEVLIEWTDRLREQTGDGFPKRVTAFRPEMAVHGQYRQPCPVCGTQVQRIAYASNETNYCPRCQTGGKVLADRSLSRLLKGDWPRTIEELEAAK